MIRSKGIVLAFSVILFTVPGQAKNIEVLFDPTFQNEHLATTQAVAYYYVDQGHQNAADDPEHGSESLPWRTIQYAADRLTAGEVVYVKTGIYDERVSPQNSGSAGSPITFMAMGNVEMQGFYIIGRDYIRIIGFEIANTPDTARERDGIYLNSCTGCEIWHNYIHDTTGLGINMREDPSHVLIKGNKFEHCWGHIAIYLLGDHHLVEYNEVLHQDDSSNVFGNYIVMRNNYFHHSTEEEFPGAHNDILQTFTHYIPGVHMEKVIFEDNYIHSNLGPDAHGLIARDGSETGIRDLIARNNVFDQIGSYTVIVTEVDGVRLVNNTFVDNSVSHSPKVWQPIHFTEGATGGVIANNVFYDVCRAGGEPYYIDTSSQTEFYADYNLTHDSGDIEEEPNGVPNQDPQFVDYGSGNFTLQSNSPAINKGGPWTLTTSSGTGTAIPVNDAGFFTNGWEIVQGDLIQVGSNAPVRIEAIEYTDNIITIEETISWNEGDWVNLTYEGSAPDIGAFEYQDEGTCQPEINIIDPVNDATVYGDVPILANVTRADCIRHVVFYINGIPVETVETSPYTHNWVTNGLPPGDYALEARAFARYATQNLWVSDAVTVTVGGLALTGLPANQAIRLNWDLNITAPFTGTWHIDYYTTTASIYSDTTPANTARSTTLTEHVYNYQLYTVTLNAMLDETVWLSDTVRVMPTDKLIYLPLIKKQTR